MFKRVFKVFGCAASLLLLASCGNDDFAIKDGVGMEINEDAQEYIVMDDEWLDAPVAENAINMMTLIGAHVDDIKHYFGEMREISTRYNKMYSFRGGPFIALDEFGHITWVSIEHLSLNLNEPDRTRFYFNDINPNSTLDDVISAFENKGITSPQPFSSNSSIGFWVDEGIFATFYFEHWNGMLGSIILQKKDEYRSPASPIITTQTSKDIGDLFLVDLDDARHMLGDEVHRVEEGKWYASMRFSSGISLSIQDDGRIVSVGFCFMENNENSFNLAGFDGSSFYEDIVGVFGEARGGRSNSSTWAVGAVKDYMYESENHPNKVLNFSFGHDGRLIYIAMFGGVFHY